MNATQMVRQKGKKRLNWIHAASVLFQGLIGFTLLMSIYWLLAFLLGWPFFSETQARIAISQGHIYASPAEMPRSIFALFLVKLGFGFWAAVMLFALFRLYGRGILFSARNILYIRFFGYWLIVNWVIDYQVQAELRDMALSTTPVLGGLLIIFIAWIMDEGRKIQEEQELTV